MQDWERTQELATEAQNSTGAAAAQYAQQIKGLEAAMTNLKTSWQSLIQSLVDSEFIIGIFKALTTIIDGINNFLSAGGNFTKNLISGLVITLSIVTAIKKVHQVRVALEQSLIEKTKKQQELQEQNEATTEEQLDAEEKITKEKNKQIEYELRALKVKKESLNLELNRLKPISEKIKENPNLNQENFQKMYQHQGGAAMDSAKVFATDSGYEKALLKEQEINVAISERQEMLKQNNANVQLNYNLQQQSLMLEHEANRAVVEQLDSIKIANDDLIRKLEIEKAITEEKIKQLEAEKNRPETNDERKTEIEETIKKLKSSQLKTEDKILKLKNKNAKIDQKRSKILTNENKQTNQIKNIVNIMADKLGKKVGVDIKGISKTIKGVVNYGKNIKNNLSQNSVSLSSLLSTEQSRASEYQKMLETGKLMGEDGKEYLLTEESRAEIQSRLERTNQNIANIQSTQKDLGTEGLVTQKQASELLQMESATQEAVTLSAEEQNVAEGVKKGIIEKTLPAEEQEAAANISESAAQPYGIGLPFAIMGAAILAAVGLGAGIGGIIGSASSSARKNEKLESGIKDNTITIYNKQNDNKTIEENLEVYSKLISKKNRTEDEDSELESALSALRELSEDFETLSDENLITAVVGLQAANNASINSLIDENFEDALKIDNLNDSVVGLQAINTKLNSRQKELVDATIDLKDSLDEVLVNKIQDSLSDVTEDIVNNYDYDSELTAADKDVRVSDYFAWGGSAASVGAVAGAAIGSFVPVIGTLVGSLIGAGAGALVGSLGTMIADLVNEGEQDQQEAKVAADLYLLQSRATEAVTTMEKELNRSNTTLTSQLQVYREVVTDQADLIVNAMKKQYSGLGFINDYISDNTVESNQVLSNIEKLTELGILTEESIEKLADTFGNIQEEQIAAQKAKEIFTQVDSNGKEVYDKTLIKFLKAFGVEDAEDGTMSVTDMYSTVMKLVAYDEEKGEYKKDGNNYYREQDGTGEWTNKTATKEIKKLEDLISRGYGSYSFTEITTLADSNFDPQQAFGTYMNDLANSVKEGMTAKERVNAIFQAANDNDEIKRYIAQEIKSYESLYNDYLNEEDSNKRATLLEKYKSTKKNAEELQTQLDSITEEIAGYMDSTKMNDRIETFESTREKVTNIKSEVASGEVSYESYQYLTENVIPTLQDAIEDFDPEVFLESVAKGEVSAIDLINQYLDTTADDNIEAFENNAAVQAIYLKEAREDYNEAVKSGDKDAIADAKAALKLAENNYAMAEQMVEYVKEMQSSKTDKQIRTFNKTMLDSRLDYLENEDNILLTYDKQKEVLEQLHKINSEEYNSQLSKTAKVLGITEEQMQAYVNMRKGLDYNVDDLKWIEKLSGDSLDNFEDIVSELLDADGELDDINDKLEEINTSRVEAVKENQDTLIEAYKNQLQAEQDALQESLDKRKDMYDKYFDALDEEDEDTDFEEEQKRLQNAIAKLSGATDATSQAKLKEYQEELADLEKDQRQTERDRRRDSVSELLDNQSEMIDQYYEERMANEKEMYDYILSLDNAATMTMLQTYTDGFKNATDVTQAYMTKSFVETIRDKNAAAGKSTEKEEAYLAAWVKWAEDPTHNEIPHYASGGLVDYTGYAWVDGTSSRPEAFLNAEQTSIFANLANVLGGMYSRRSYSNNDDGNSTTVTIENFTVAVDATLTDNNVQQTGESLADALMEGLRRTGISVNVKR